MKKLWIFNCICFLLLFWVKTLMLDLATFLHTINRTVSFFSCPWHWTTQPCTSDWNQGLCETNKHGSTITLSKPWRQRCKRSLLTTVLDRAHRLSSSWAYFSEECDCLKKVFAHLKYPERLVNSTINTFLQSRIVDKQPSQTSKEPRAIVRVVIPFKDQESANYVKKDSAQESQNKGANNCPAVFVSRKLHQDLKVRETKAQIVTNNASFVVFSVTFVMRVMWAILADTYTHVWMDINKRHLQYTNTTTNSTAKSRKIFWGVLAFWKSVEISSIVWWMKCFSSET